jgi:hypothetical protein
VVEDARASLKPRPRQGRAMGRRAAAAMEMGVGRRAFVSSPRLPPPPPLPP